mgnify:CR=1 FL=1
MDLVTQGIATWPRATMAVLGSSLGGFYASWVARHTGCPSVLLNPAVHPARDLARHIGEQTAWHDPAERFFFLPEYIAELQALAAKRAQSGADAANPVAPIDAGQQIKVGDAAVPIDPAGARVKTESGC